MLLLACAYHDSSEGIHVDKLFYRQVLKNVLNKDSSIVSPDYWVSFLFP